MARLSFSNDSIHQLFARSSLSFSLFLRRSESVTLGVLEGSYKESLVGPLDSLGKLLGSLSEVLCSLEGGVLILLNLLGGSNTSISLCSVSMLLMFSCKYFSLISKFLTHSFCFPDGTYDF